MTSPTRPHSFPVAAQKSTPTARDEGALPRRARQLLRADIDFIPNPGFLRAGAEHEIGAETLAICADATRDTKTPRDLPGHLARLCESKLLSAEEERRLFRRMNFVKFKAHAIRSELDAEHPDVDALERAERHLAEARAIRDRIVKSNMRLVMSIVKKFATPRFSFDDMLSDGIYALMQATEKFDYDRGFRFSTYAYRAIARSAYRRIADGQKENERYAANADELVANTVDERCSTSVYDQAWERLRTLLAQFLHRLDRREQFIIRSRYALGAHRKVRTFQCLADKLGVSKERVRQLEQRAVGKLQGFAAEQPIDDLLAAAVC